MGVGGGNRSCNAQRQDPGEKILGYRFALSCSLPVSPKDAFCVEAQTPFSGDQPEQYRGINTMSLIATWVWSGSKGEESVGGSVTEVELFRKYPS